MEQIVLLVDSNLLKTWSGRRDSNPRRPAWEAGIPHVIAQPIHFVRFSEMA
jgi:hypothetical protein